jgi:hypothetical protein
MNDFKELRDHVIPSAYAWTMEESNRRGVDPWDIDVEVDADPSGEGVRFRFHNEVTDERGEAFIAASDIRTAWGDGGEDAGKAVTAIFLDAVKLKLIREPIEL